MEESARREVWTSMNSVTGERLKYEWLRDPDNRTDQGGIGLVFPEMVNLCVGDTTVHNCLSTKSLKL